MAAPEPASSSSPVAPAAATPPQAAAPAGGGTAGCVEVLGWSNFEHNEFLTKCRDWQAVDHFFAAVVRGEASLQQLGLQGPCHGDEEAGQALLQGQPATAPAGAATALHAAHATASRQAAWPLQELHPARGPMDTPTDVPEPLCSQQQVGGGASQQPAAAAAAPGAAAGGNDSAASVQAEGAAAARDTASTPGAGAGGGGRKKQRERGCGQNQRYTYKVLINYYGGGFAGWAYQPGRVTVEGVLQQTLAPLATPRGGSTVVAAAGRTDKGVHAHGMPVSFYSWQRLTEQQVISTVNAAAPGQLAALGMQFRPRTFHATFSATWRRYVYILPLRASAEGSNGGAAVRVGPPLAQHDPSSGLPPARPEVYDVDVDTARLAELLRCLEGKSLDYGAFARDTPPGKDGSCTLAVARVHVIALPPRIAPGRGGAGAACAAAAASDAGGVAAVADGSARGEGSCHHDDDCVVNVESEGLDPAAVAAAAALWCAAIGNSSPEQQGPGAVAFSGRRGGGGDAVRAVCVELVGDRFLRKMVRVLVSTAVREATPGAGKLPGRDDALLELCRRGERRLTGVPAPAGGLCFAGAGYAEEQE